MEKFAKIDLPLEGIPLYTIQQILNTLTALGYDVTNIKYNESVPELETDHKIYSIMFDIQGVPITKISPDDQVINVVFGKASINIFSVFTIHENIYYVEDIIMSNFYSDFDTTSYKSFAIDNLFHAMLKTFLSVKTEEPVSK